MKRLVTLLAVGAVAALVLATLSLSAVKKTVWTAALSSGQEVPKQVMRDTAAHGLFKGTLVGDKLHWKLTFAKRARRIDVGRCHVGPEPNAGLTVNTVFALNRL